MKKLSLKNCIPCQGGVPILSPSEVATYLPQISERWTVTHGDTRLICHVRTMNFANAMVLANKIGEIAEDQWHHPVLVVGFGELSIEVWTHKINGLVESDFIFASKVDEVLAEFSSLLE